MSMSTDSLNNGEIQPPNPIRVETALSRYPVHRLAKHGGDIAIDIREVNEHGELTIKWEVTHNRKYGHPGPLAYKLDTLLINRRIEEAKRPIPKFLKLGSLREITAQLGVSTHATDQIRKALSQNASAYIVAVINYKLTDGTTKRFEGEFHRYSVILTGEDLPDGRKADAVYIVLNDVYMMILNGAMTRPLDYDYLKSLPPASQRFYELLSFQMYAAIKNDRPRAKLLYSELCTYAPLVRQTDWNVVRPQLARIHAPHKASGYINRVDFQDTVDHDGKPDWIMLYQPGPKARAEYRAFTKRGGPVMLEAGPLTHDPLPLLATDSPSPLVAALIVQGVSDEMARQLVADHAEEKIRQQIEILEWRLAGKKADKIVDPAAWLVSAIRSPNGHTAPKSFVSKAERQRREEAKQAKAREEAEARRRKQQAEAAEKAKQRRDDDYLKRLTVAELAELDERSLADDPESRQREDGPLKAMMQRTRRLAFIRRLLDERDALADA